MNAPHRQGDLPYAGVEPYRCVAMDPPWPERGGGGRGAQNHYDLMKVPDIIDLVVASPPIARVAGEAIAWVWVTDTYLRGGLDLLDALGFRYVRCMVWVKLRSGEGAPHTRLQTSLGQYMRSGHELCLLGVRGKDMRPPPEDRVPSVVFAPRVKNQRGQDRHSAKPPEAFAVFERVSPGPRVEMFARAERPGWDVWGNEAPLARGEAPGG